MRNTSPPSRLLVVMACLFFASILYCATSNTEPTEAGEPVGFGTVPVHPSASDPLLSAPGLNATFGYANRTTFLYTITYQSDSNATPSHVNVTIIHEHFITSHVMEKTSATASNYSAGVQYQAKITLPVIGNYSHYFTAENPYGTARQPASGFFPGPSIVWLRNYTMSEVSFQWRNASTIPTVTLYPFIYNISTLFTCAAYDYSTNKIQISELGFLRVKPIALTDAYARVNMTSTSIFSHYVLIAISDRIISEMYRIESNIKLFSGEDYFVFQETALFTNFDYTKYYNASFQYVIFKNGSLMLSYDYIDYNFPKMETIGINFGDGTFYTAHSFSSNFQHKSFLFNYNYINATHITKVSCSPESGNHLTEFTFSLLFQNLENWGPHAVILTLGGTNYTMSPVSTSDIDYVNGCAYSKMVQFLSPGTSYNHSFHVLTSHGWWHSPPINGPVTADLPRFNYATCKLHYFDNPVLTSPISVSSLFQTINLPFNFTFYGVNFTNLTLSRYGFIRFNTDTSETQPVPGSTASSSRVAITFGDNTVNDGGTAVLYQLFPDKAVFSFPSMTYYGGFNLPLGTYKFILYKSGDIVISFSNLQAILAGGVNMGNGFHFTLINFTQSSVPLVNESFIFLPPRINVPQVAGNVSGTLFKSSESITFQGTYTSSGNIPVVRAWIKIEGCSYKGTTFSAMVYQLTFIATGFTDYRGNARFTLSRMLGSGLYNGTITFIDIYGTRFNTTMIHFSVNDPPDCIADPTSAYGGVGKTLTIRVSYRDPEGFAPASLTIRWDGVNMTMNPSSSDFSSTVYFTRSILLEHGIHNYEIFVKDQHRPETVSVTTTARTINVKHLPVIEILNFPQANVLIPGEFEVKVRITSLEPGFAVADLYVSVNGKQYRDWRQATGEPGTFMASIRLDWGTYIISIAVTDGYNEVVYPAAGSITITVINLPLIIGLILGAGSAIAITLLVQLKRKKAAAAQQARLRQQVLAKKPTRRDIADLVEQKRKDRQEEMKQIDAMDIVQPAPAPIKKSAAIKRATSGTPSNTGATTSPTRVAKPAPSGGTQPKDKSGYSQKVTDTGTVVNRTVLKEYIERKRKEGVRELHYIQIKNDLNVISQKKSSKLYRILQDLVEDEILIRKGSNYVIVG